MNDDELTFVVLKYGDTTISSNYAFHKDTLNKALAISMLFYLIRYAGHNILIDTGAGDGEVFKSNGFDMQHFCEPVSILESYGLMPEEITDIIITHAHFDHIGDIGSYKNATVYIQEDEFAAGQGYIQNNRKVVTFKSSIKIADKINAECIGGHSAGSSIVTFKHGGYVYVVGGDECYLNECLKKQIPTGSLYNIEKSREFVNKFSKANYKVFLFHEPGIIKEDLGYKVIIP